MKRKRTSRGGKTFYGGTQEDFEIRNDMPYGMWTCANGREVLFNRFYEPLLERTNGDAPRPADPTEWIGSISSQTYFYADGTKDKRRAAAQALKEWRL